LAYVALGLRLTTGINPAILEYAEGDEKRPHAGEL
jgi:hypothetical protein